MLALRERVDRCGEPHVAVCDPARIVAGQPEVDAVPDARELRVMVGLLGVKRDPGEERERLAEILEPEAAGQRLAAVFEGAAVGDVHCWTLRLAVPILQWTGRKSSGAGEKE